MVTERIPGKIREKPVILMTIVSIMRKDDVRSKRMFHRFEKVLHPGALKRKEASLELFHDYLVCYVLEKGLRAGTSFVSTLAFRAENDPPNVHIRSFPYPFQDCPAAADLYVISVRAETKNVLCRLG